MNKEEQLINDLLDVDSLYTLRDYVKGRIEHYMNYSDALTMKTPSGTYEPISFTIKNLFDIYRGIHTIDIDTYGVFVKYASDNTVNIVNQGTQVTYSVKSAELNIVIYISFSQKSQYGEAYIGLVIDINDDKGNRVDQLMLLNSGNKITYKYMGKDCTDMAHRVNKLFDKSNNISVGIYERNFKIEIEDSPEIYDKYFVSIYLPTVKDGKLDDSSSYTDAKLLVKHLLTNKLIEKYTYRLGLTDGI